MKVRNFAGCTISFLHLANYVKIKKTYAMQDLYFYWKKNLPVFALVLLLPTLGAAQINDPVFEQMEQMMRRFQEQMRRGMAFDTSFQGGQLQYSPDSSSYFYYHIDTSFNGIGGSHFFQFSPFGESLEGGFPDMDSLFQQFFGRMAPPGRQQDYGSDFPADDGQQEPADDGLLPEERLRRQEEHPDAPKAAPAKPEKPAKSSVKTIRI